MINIKLSALWLQAAGCRLQAAGCRLQVVWVMSDALSLATCRL